MSKEKRIVIGVFRDSIKAEQAYDRLWARGYTDGQIHVMMSDEAPARYYPGEDGDKPEHPVGSQATEGMAVGGATGAAIGATLAGIAAVGTALVIPGLNLVVAGPLAAALAGAGAGAVSGGLLGALIGYGIPESNAKSYEAALTEGGIVIGVEIRDDDDADEVKKIFRDLKAENVHST